MKKEKECPICDEPMEYKGYINEPEIEDSDYSVGISIYQCPACKNIEMDNK